jgi:conjugal transfer pilus assembly protein TraK
MGFGVLASSMSLQAAEDPGIALPSVPRSVLLAANEAPAMIRHVSASSSDLDTGYAPEPSATALALGPKTIQVAPGTTTIVEVAIDHLNRLLTPFAAPQVRTVSQATTQVDGNAVYVATATEEPVSLFITEADDTAMAISLTLAPRHIPPREVRLVLTGGTVPTAAPRARPSRPLVRNDQPYVEQIASVFRALARDRVPAGFELRKARRGECVSCGHLGLSVTTVQVFEGQGRRILVAKARNRGEESIVLDEHRCGVDAGALVAAVAAWPRTRLAPGEETEVFVAVHPDELDHESGDRLAFLDGPR